MSAIGTGLPPWYAQAQQGYAQLLQQVQGQIAGVGQSQAQAIKDTYAQQYGQAAQDLASRGLGNSTVSSSVQRGLTLDEQKAQVALQNQLAQLQAGYTAQLGGAQLGFETQYAQQQQQYQQQQNLQAQGYAQQYALAQQQKQPFNANPFVLGFGPAQSRSAAAAGYTNIGGF